MADVLFAGIPVHDHDAAVHWYERFFGRPATFQAHPTESVWEVAEGGWVYVLQQPEDAGHAMLTVLVADLDAVVAELAGRGVEPATDETYGGGTRKVTYRDPDGNELGYGQAPG